MFSPPDTTRFLRNRPAAFTLVEMLVATALCSILLAALWTLYSTYADLFDRGQARVERSQLSRALMMQIADDLQAAIQDPVPGLPDEPAGEAQRRRFGLSGTSSGLRMDVLQVTPLQGNQVPVGRESPGGDAPAARVPELRTISYEFSARSGDDPDQSLSRAGLVRRELDFETPLDDQGGFEATAPDATAGQPGGGPRAADDSLIVVPEVVSLQFRYFDGTSWSSSWNSIQRRTLPAAVEVTLTIADPNVASPPVTADVDPETFEEETAAPAASPSSATALRMVVDLPASPEYRKVAAAAQPAAAARPRASPRRIAPPRWTGSGESRPQRRPDDWIRTGTR